MQLIATFVLALLSISRFEVAFSDSAASVQDQSSSFYTAAVVELFAPGLQFKDPQDVVEANLAEYLRLVKEAKSKGADILVFAEATLNYFGINTYEEIVGTAVDYKLTEISNPLDCSFGQSKILNELSQAASNSSIYLLVNIVEREPCHESDIECKKGFKLYNTNIAFDRKGCIVSKYRKFNLFWEPFMTKAKTPELASFTTDFGVTFGHVVCFDLVFKSPSFDLVKSGISHILYPTAWYQETPNLNSNQIQQAFAQGSNVVLLASGANWPERSNTGSGIYVGRHGAVEKLTSHKHETRMLVAKIPKDVNDPDFIPKESTIEPYRSTEMEKLLLLLHYEWPTVKLSPSHKKPMKNVVCEFSLNYTKLDSNDGFNYRLSTYNGIRQYLNITSGGEVHCTILACMGEGNCGRKFGDKISSIKFHEIEISMTILENIEDFLVMPTTVENRMTSLSPKSYEFSKKSDGNVLKFTIRSNNVERSMLTFGLYARRFSLDGQPPTDML